MEKLTELLNEWSKTAIENKCNWTDVYDEEGVYFLNLFDRDMTMEMEDVISKRNGFIKWLVENDKIDRKRKMIKQVWTGGTLDLMNFDRIQDIEYYSIEETLLMLLSISDTPIEDLISYLR